jgi:hypothetical protein
MTIIRIEQGLPFVSVTVTHNGQVLPLDHVLLDTGSAATVFGSDQLGRIGLRPEPEDSIRFMRGVGGREAVIEKQIDNITVGELTAARFVIQMGALDYGLPMDGILGLDFLRQVGAIVDLKQLQVR